MQLTPWRFALLVCPIIGCSDAEFSVIAYAIGVSVHLPAADLEKDGEAQHEPVNFTNQLGVFRRRAW
jgi:hypothetical protein